MVVVNGRERDSVGQARNIWATDSAGHPGLEYLGHAALFKKTRQEEGSKQL